MVTTPAKRSPSTKTTNSDGVERVRLRDAEVLEAAAQVFARRGYASATVQDVASELGMLKGSIYYYIKSKEDLLFRVLDGVHDDVDALLREVMEIEDLDPLERLCEYVRRQVRYNLRNLVRVSVYYNDIDRLSDARRNKILQRSKVHQQMTVDVIRDGQLRGLIDNGRDAHLLAYNLYATVVWPYRWFMPGGRTAVDEVVEGCVRFVRSGLTSA